MSSNQKINIKIEQSKFFGIDIVYFKTFASSGILFFVVVFFVLGVVLPRFEEVGATNDKIAKIDKEIKEFEEREKFLVKIDPTQVRESESVFYAALLESKDLYFIMNVLSKIGIDFGFTVDSFSVSPGDLSAGTNNKNVSKNTKQSLPKVPVNVVMLGPASRYLELVRAIETTLPLLEIGSYDLSSSDVSQATLTMSVNIFSAQPFVVGSKEPPLSDLKLDEKDLQVYKTLSGFRGVEVGRENLLIGESLSVGVTREDPFSF